MTQRIFDIENKKDYTDLWDILPDWVYKVVLEKIECFDKPRVVALSEDGVYHLVSDLIAIDWHDKTEIIRPIKEATEADVEKICAFWDIDIEHPNYGLFLFKTKDGLYVGKDMSFRYKHCRRLTKQEIEELI